MPTATLRQHIKQQRKRLNAQQKNKASRHAALKLRRCVAFKKAKKVGIYLDAFGEVPTKDMIKLCVQHNKQLYVPHIHPVHFALRFTRFYPKHITQKKLYQHRMGMLQPKGRTISAKQLQCLITPAVAIDHHHHRLGMGGGYYDRTLFKHPHLVSIAPIFSFQWVSKLQVMPWDKKINHILIVRTQ